MSVPRVLLVLISQGNVMCTQKIHFVSRFVTTFTLDQNLMYVKSFKKAKILRNETAVMKKKNLYNLVLFSYFEYAMAIN